jgi:hypothetical protein
LTLLAISYDIHADGFNVSEAQKELPEKK